MSTKEELVLSITIPTYNRAYLLRETLSQLLKNIHEEGLYGLVEVVVCDNASTDDTGAVVAELNARNRFQVKYHKNEQNLGVIKNILKTIELSLGEFWMFYGDDDVIPAGALTKLIAGFQAHKKHSAFMYRLPEELNEYCRELKSDTVLSMEELTSKYFYYIGNAGIFSVNTKKAQAVVENHFDRLVATCWPQTLVLFIAVLTSENKTVQYLDIISSIPPGEGIVISNSYYLFETTIYALLRTALDIEKITQMPFTSRAIRSVYGIQHFEQLKQQILERYCFYDLPKQKSDFEAAVKQAFKEIPEPYKKEIRYLYRQINLPVAYLRFRIYLDYARNIRFSELKTSFIKKLKILSPLGFNAMITEKKAAAIKKKMVMKRAEVDSSTGYF